MSIWTNPEISFNDFGTFVTDKKNRNNLKKSWSKSPNRKKLASELKSHEICEILLLFMKQCIAKKNKKASPNDDDLRDAAMLFSDWIVENKLSDAAAVRTLRLKVFVHSRTFSILHSLTFSLFVHLTAGTMQWQSDLPLDFRGRRSVDGVHCIEAVS